MAASDRSLVKSPSEISGSQHVVSEGQTPRMIRFLSSESSQQQCSSWHLSQYNQAIGYSDLNFSSSSSEKSKKSTKERMLKEESTKVEQEQKSSYLASTFKAGDK